MAGTDEHIPVRKLNDYSKNPHGIFVRSIAQIRKRAGKCLSVPKKLEFYKLVYIDKGHGSHKVDLHNIKLRPQTMLLISPGTVQCFSEANDLEGFAIHFSRSFFLRENENIKYLFKLNQLRSHSAINCSPEMAFMLNQLKSTFDSISSDDDYEQLINYLRLLFFELRKRSQSSLDNSSFEQLCFQFQMALENEVTYQTKVRDICESMNTDARQLNSVLKNSIGKCAKELLDERLILEIKRLLMFSGLSAKEISFKLKFDEPANLSNFFKRHTLQTPMQFRNQNKQSLFL